MIYRTISSVHDCMSGDAQKRLFGNPIFLLPTLRNGKEILLVLRIISIWNSGLWLGGQTDTTDRTDRTGHFLARMSKVILPSITIIYYRRFILVRWYVDLGYGFLFSLFSNNKEYQTKALKTTFFIAINNHRNRVTWY